MRNRKQFLVACGSAAAAIAMPSLGRAETPSDRPDYGVESYGVPGLGSIRTLSFASTADRPALTIVAAILDRRRVRVTVVSDSLPGVAMTAAEGSGFPPTVSYSQMPASTPLSASNEGITARVDPAMGAILEADRDDSLRQISAERYRASSQLREIAERHNATIAINGGFFDMESFAPRGLLIVDGKTISPPTAQYSGAVVVDANGVPSVTRIADVSHPAYAVQAGPFLIDVGESIGQLDDPAWDRRTFVAQTETTFVAAMASAVSLHNLAELLVQRPDAFGVSKFDAALNLGGAATAGFFAKVNGTIIASSNASLRSPDTILFGGKT